MINIRPHKKLEVWKLAINFVVDVYALIKVFPREEEYGLKSQLRRACVSVPSNIAEGLTRKTYQDKLHFLNIAQSSLSEIDTQIEIALKLRYITEKNYSDTENKLIDIQKLLSGLSRSIAKYDK